MNAALASSPGPDDGAAGSHHAPSPLARRAVELEMAGIVKTFGRFKAVDDVSIKVPAGEFHALLGENGAGKSTLVKCLTGYHAPDRGEILVDGRQVSVHDPREAQALGIGMVYQHFTLAPALTGAENLVISRNDTPALIDWARERRALDEFLDRVPFRVPLHKPVGALSAGERQKLEILKLLYVNQRFLILDEPTSVLTPAEADEILGLLRDMTRRGEVSVLMISHKFREVTAFADAVSVLRRGRYAGGGRVGDLSVPDMIGMMIGDAPIRKPAMRVSIADTRRVLEIAALHADDDAGMPALRGVDLSVDAGQIVGIAGISGNGQSPLMEVLSGQRPASSGRVTVSGQHFEPTRRNLDRFAFHNLPEEPLKNATAPRMSVAENLAFRTFDKPPIRGPGRWLSPAAIRRASLAPIERYNVKTVSPDAPIATLSGGNVQRAVLARELGHAVAVLVIANPCFGLDFASAADIRAQIIEQRNQGAAVVLISEDLDEIFELADVVAVMSEGRINYQSPVGATDRATLGRYMAAHRADDEAH